MEELRQTFLIDSTSKLSQLHADLTKASGMSPALEREIFRALHTIKGTAQTFGLTTPAHLAHTLENLLTFAKNNAISPSDAKNLLTEGLEVLRESLTDNNFKIPASFIEKFKPFRGEFETINTTDNLQISGLSEEIIAQLSAPEKTALNSALTNGNDLLVLKIGFDAKDFAAEFKNFREKLNENGEIIATLPAAKFAAEGKIGFEIIYATAENTGELFNDFPVEITFQSYQIFSNNPAGILWQVVGHGKSLAARFGKEIEFEISIADELEKVSAPASKIIFDALTHLVRNAVDHGIKHDGKIKIEIRRAGENVFLRVSDDGQGIDLKQIREKAVAQNLITRDAELSDEETLNLIFAYGFSTRDAVSEISGRGVGLDAVKDLIEKNGGRIVVKSTPEKGTTFEIFLQE